MPKTEKQPAPQGARWQGLLQLIDPRKTWPANMIDGEGMLSLDPFVQKIMSNHGRLTDLQKSVYPLSIDSCIYSCKIIFHHADIFSSKLAL